MPVDIYALLHKKKQTILEIWINHQLANDALRDELISNEEGRMQSEELLDAFLNQLRTGGREGTADEELDSVSEILETITVARARKGYSPRETGIFLFSFKNAVLKVLSEEISDPRALLDENIRLSNKVDNLAIESFETFIKGGRSHLRQTDEIAENISIRR